MYCQSIYTLASFLYAAVADRWETDVDLLCECLVWSSTKQLSSNALTPNRTTPSSHHTPQALCISVTTLKRLCRRHGVKRWPHRQLSGLNRAVSHLEAKRLALKDGPNDPIIADQLRQLYCRRDVIIDVSLLLYEVVSVKAV